MSVFDGKRLPAGFFQIDTERLREGWYSDAYFLNTEMILTTLAEEGYNFNGMSDIIEIDNINNINGISPVNLNNGDIIVEMQFFTRRRPFSLIAGTDEAIAILRECTGYFNDKGQFVNTYHTMEVEAAMDGVVNFYEGNPKEVSPIMKIKGKYRDFARLETPILGVLTESTRIATNVYNVLAAAGGKDIMFFPARFAHYKVQEMHGYAYALAVKAYNQKYGKSSRAIVSTNAQGNWWGAHGGGTVAHASIACFLGDTAETMMQFCRVVPQEVPRIALVDFHNDCVGDTLKVMEKMFLAFLELYQAGRYNEAEKYRLFGVRLDTSGNMRDVSIPPLGDKNLDCGVNPRLVWNVRNAIDRAYESWDFPDSYAELAKAWCQQVKIIATGGFDAAKISRFEEMRVPVDIYGVGSSFLENSNVNNTKNDFTADIVKVKIDDKWYDLSKVGRRSCSNPDLGLVGGI
ncbi:nicotinate phosphoribosyltransferase [Phosphitispora sp. TUW77]|uniref:nicotinate phosphoribosyltransferase n=1 Tax=Phosphitispora sp. TUW77 TaxID=3152361 RepID=UPI003AB31FA2